MISVNKLSTDVITEIYSYLTIRSISNILVVSKLFNIKSDILWRIFMKSEFGVERKICNSWKDTAILLSQCNMINMSKRWIDGRTYHEIYTDSFTYPNYFDIVDYNRNSSVFYQPSNIIDEKTAREYVIKHYPKTNLDAFRIYYDNVPTQSDRPNYVLTQSEILAHDDRKVFYRRFMTREMVVLSCAHSHVIPYDRMTIPSALQFPIIDYDGVNLFMADPISYVMCYSLVPHDKLLEISSSRCGATSHTRITSDVKSEDHYMRLVKSRYGVDKMYGTSWTDTHYLFSGTNMINLGKRWIDGRTYYDILNANEIHLGSTYLFPSSVINQASVLSFVNVEVSKHKTVDKFNDFKNMYGIDIRDRAAIEYHLRAITREFAIVNLAITDLKSGMIDIGYKGTLKERAIFNKIKTACVDPVLLVASYSRYNNTNISELALSFMK